jgi:hypothetical protein
MWSGAFDIARKVDTHIVSDNEGFHFNEKFDGDTASKELNTEHFLNP